MNFIHQKFKIIHFCHFKVSPFIIGVSFLYIIMVIAPITKPFKILNGKALNSTTSNFVLINCCIVTHKSPFCEICLNLKQPAGRDSLRDLFYHIFSHPDFTVGYGIAPYQLLLADYTAGQELHLAPKTIIFSVDCL